MPGRSSHPRWLKAALTFGAICACAVASAAIVVAETSPTPQYPAAQLSLSATAGPVGTPVTFSGSGYPPNAALSIYVADYPPVNDASPARISTSAETDANGSFQVHGAIPDEAYGDHSLCAATDSVKTCAHFFVQPQISISVSQGPPGTVFNLKGTGFPAYESVALYADTPNPYFGTPGPQADPYGGFNQTITWPTNTTAGAHLVCGDTGLPSFPQPVKVKGCATFVVAALSSHITLSPPSGPVGTQVDINGDGFAPTSNFLLDIDGQPLLCSTNPSDFATDVHGALVAHLTIDLRMRNQICGNTVVNQYGPRKICVHTGSTMSCADFNLLNASGAATPTQAATKQVAVVSSKSGLLGPLGLFALGGGIVVLALLGAAGLFWRRRMSNRGSLPPTV